MTDDLARGMSLRDDGVSSKIAEVSSVDGGESQQSALGVRHALLVYTSPSKLFQRVEDTGAYGWALVTLLLLVTLAGYVQIQSGLIDNVVNANTDKQLAGIEKDRANLVDRGRLKEAMEDIRKNGEFVKTITRLRVVVLAPLTMLAEFLLVASVLYAAVALTGRKPEYHTLMSICVYAGFIDLIAHVVRVAMMLTYRTLDVDTSLALLVDPGKATPLAAGDPFLIWFWVLVGIGLTVTRQLSRRVAIASCALMCLMTMGVRVGMSYAMA